MGWFRKKKQNKPTSGLSVHRTQDGTLVVHLRGMLTAAGLTMVQQRGARELETSGMAKVLLVLDGFRGFAKGAAMDDLTFLLEHDTEAIRVAIVGDPKWRDDFLAFTGAGNRRARVEFFSADSLKQAEEWLGS